MAVRVTRDVVCDVCGTGPARRWTIQRKDGRMQRTGDLCVDHERDLQVFLDAFVKVRGRVATREILTPEQIKRRNVK